MAEFKLPPLGYALDGLEPYMSTKSLALHYEVLHRRYVETVNRLLTKLDPLGWNRYRSAESRGSPTMRDLVEWLPPGFVYTGRSAQTLQNAANQAYAHQLFWRSMRPPTGAPGVPDGPLAKLIKRDFGSLPKLREQFVADGVKVFGSGWVWLCIGGQEPKLFVETTAPTGVPLRDGVQPLLVCDVWEHAYYLDFGPERADFLVTWFDMLADWPSACDRACRHLVGEGK